MDFKGLAWADNVYEKFEAMCLEVEEVMRQDTVKYVENQVQKVGINVKKLYSEIMQDLLPLSGVDPVKVAAGDVSLSPCAHLDMNEKPKAMLENSDLKKESTEDKLNADEDVGKKLSLSGLGDKRGTSLLCNLRESCVPPSDQTNVMLSTDLVGSCNSVDAVITNDSIIKAPATFLDVDGDVVSQQGSNISSNKCDIKSVAEDKFDVGVIHNDEVVEPRADILEQYDKSNLEESCVMVEGDMLRFFLQETAKQKSFKKKIREAFLSKLISRKPEYHKLFVQYGNRDGMEATEMVIPGSNKVSDNAKLQGLNFSDSDWELL
ncbi:uncharacterized protein LOC111384634 isoform X1 [Olea europaea var. sylvestris]|uniref:uncharacterized protein LOC111384634 isoform X1 n=1 Tax=Olea europaea var. sylvestris TaxID=158386 RepID=UPI000C1D0A24|nr:uncharacterized protein LOC111384634 isoform X1 [Olea europaea var. sylvestris]XP_022864710.1 uncharacterized protein LOC111384634 isoform X1 [Olea europaea var. sylvestris]